MIYFPATKAAISAEFPVAVGASIAAEGQCLIADNTGGVFGAKPSAGGGSEVFLGIAVSQQMPLEQANNVEAFVQPSSNTVTLAFTPVSGTIGVYDATDAAFLTVTTDWTVSGSVITLESDTLGHELVVYYKFAPTVAQALAIQGSTIPGGAPGVSIGQVGVLRNGVVYTDQFDTSVDWNAATIAVKSKANGQFTIGGGGTTLTSVKVISPPSVGMPFLGLLLG